MIKRAQIALMALVLSALQTGTSQACTSFTLKGNDNGRTYGRTMEFGMPMQSKAILIQRGTELVGVGPNGKAGSGKPWTTRYAVAGLNALGLDMVVDGMNEKGLSGGMLNFPGWAKYQKVSAAQARNSIVSWQMLMYVLSQFGSLDEVKAGLPKVLVNGAPLGSFGGTVGIHMTLHDNQGRSLSVEYIDGALQLKENPTGVYTNNPPLAFHLASVGDAANMSNLPAPTLKVGGMTLPPASSGEGFYGLPGDFLSSSRFVQAFTFARFAPTNLSTQQQVGTAFRILGQFDLPPGSISLPVGSAYGGADTSASYEITEWTAVADMKNLVYYIQTYDNPDLRSLRFDQLPLAGGQIKTMPLDQPMRITTLMP